jgi:hypothetical protein
MAFLTPDPFLTFPGSQADQGKIRSGAIACLLAGRVIASYKEKIE